MTLISEALVSSLVILYFSYSMNWCSWWTNSLIYLIILQCYHLTGELAVGDEGEGLGLSLVLTEVFCPHAAKLHVLLALDKEVSLPAMVKTQIRSADSETSNTMQCVITWGVTSEGLEKWIWQQETEIACDLLHCLHSAGIFTPWPMTRVISTHF